MDYYGYAGKIAYIDLTRGKVEEKPLDLDMAEKFLGGWGLSDRLIFDLLTPGLDPLSPDAPLILGAGPLCGTLVPGSGKCTADYKRPIEGHPTETKHPVSVAVGGTQKLATMVKSAGYDHIVITGRSPQPCYLYIGSDGIQILEALDLWGRKDLLETTDELRKRYHRPGSGTCGVWAIGEAGEKGVKWSQGIVDFRGTMGRFGGGAVLGSKNLKAVVAWGNQGVRVADPRRFLRLVDRKREEITHLPEYGCFSRLHGGGNLHPDFPPEAYDTTRICGRACSGCLGPEYDVHRIRDGEFEGLIYAGFYWSLREFRSWLKLKDWRQLVAFANLMNRTGLDFVTAFKMIGFLAKMYARGVISKEDTGGVEIKMGDFDSYVKMTRKIIDKEDIFGVAAEGWYPIGRIVGMDKFDDFKDGLPIVKGGDILQDARFSRLTPNTLGCITFSKPQHTHNPTYYYPDASSYHGHDPKEVEPLLMTLDYIKWAFANRMATTRFDFEKIFTRDGFNIGRLGKHCEDCKGVYNSLGVCDISPYGTKDPVQDLPFLAEVYSAATGIAMTPDQLKKCGERVWNLNRLINAREGFHRQDDRWPTQYLDNTEIPVKLRSGPSYLVDWFGRRMKREDLPKILDDYYDERGWELNGIPSKRKVEELGLEAFQSWKR